MSSGSYLKLGASLVSPATLDELDCPVDLFGLGSEEAANQGETLRVDKDCAQEGAEEQENTVELEHETEEGAQVPT